MCLLSNAVSKKAHRGSGIVAPLSTLTLVGGGDSASRSGPFYPRRDSLTAH